VDASNIITGGRQRRRAAVAADSTFKAPEAFAPTRGGLDALGDDDDDY
jgi:hypothetical protein